MLTDCPRCKTPFETADDSHRDALCRECEAELSTRRPASEQPRGGDGTGFDGSTGVIVADALDLVAKIRTDPRDSRRRAAPTPAGVRSRPEPSHEPLRPDARADDTTLIDAPAVTPLERQGDPPWAGAASAEEHVGDAWADADPVEPVVPVDSDGLLHPFPPRPESFDVATPPRATSPVPQPDVPTRVLAAPPLPRPPEPEPSAVPTRVIAAPPLPPLPEAEPSVVPTLVRASSPGSAPEPPPVPTIILERPPAPPRSFGGGPNEVPTRAGLPDSVFRHAVPTRVTPPQAKPAVPRVDFADELDTEHPEPPRRRRRPVPLRAWVAAAGLALVVGAAMGWLASSPPSRRATPPVDPSTAATAPKPVAPAVPAPRPRVVVLEPRRVAEVADPAHNGCLEVTTRPAARVSVGKKTLTTPVKCLELPAGAHRIVLESSAARVREELLVTIRAGDVTRLDRNLSGK